MERCDQPIHCYSRLNASVFAIEINNNTSNLLGVIRDRETSLRKTFTNNGSAAIERRYNATEGVWRQPPSSFPMHSAQSISSVWRGNLRRL
ncbi:hypothetical protein Ocin01_19830 [Orchesella cincta]|uniref:Uncharacterized protein n=1 Tax=Orchesella cincta TaxID=48709 RepID=A0A1D2M1N3_ORCCI|nr:hypothetical protein Ocin01_19830 [Orchesella cincta]